LGVEIERTDHAGAFFTHTGSDVFHYKNYNVGKYSFSFLNSPKRLSRSNISLGIASIKFFYDIKKVNTSELEALTFGEFISRWPHSNFDFINRILMPMLSTICTCDYDSIKQYPANILIDYLACGVAEEGVWKATHGVADIVSKITKGYEIKTHCQIEKITQNKTTVELSLKDGEHYQFDHIVVATQPQHAGPMIEKQQQDLANHLNDIPFAISQMVVHRDHTIYPLPWQELSPVCYSVDKDQQRPMATVCLNKSMPSVKDCRPVFQTWHPTAEIKPSSILASITFERPIINHSVLKHIEAIKSSMSETDNRVWFCGSYLGGGVPLLEGGVRSALAVANTLGVETPW
jgi:predicted NAD/FAD-binding protein